MPHPEEPRQKRKLGKIGRPRHSPEGGVTASGGPRDLGRRAHDGVRI